MVPGPPWSMENALTLAGCLGFVEEYLETSHKREYNAAKVRHEFILALPEDLNEWFKQASQQ